MDRVTLILYVCVCVCAVALTCVMYEAGGSLRTRELFGSREEHKARTVKRVTGLRDTTSAKLA